MDNNLQVLIQMGDIDFRLNEIDELKGDLPELVESQKEFIKKLNIDSDERKNKLKEIDNQLFEKKHIIEDTNNKLEKYKKQLYLVTTNKEYDALLTEIDHSKSLLSNTQNSFSELSESKETIIKNLEENSKNIEETIKKLSQSERDLNNALNESEDEYKNLHLKRSDLEKKIDTKFLGLYNRMKSGRSGIGITSVHKNACGSCFNVLPPQTVIEIRKGDKVVTCHSCGIILFWEDYN